MNKAAFLNIVRQVAPIQDQEVDDLERLVVSFPYCQTAHVLLAKAAHDRGSMLSTQKLRRAAAHVSNRQLLKQLVYATPSVEETPTYVEEELETSNHSVSGQILENEPQNEVLAYEEEPEVLAAEPETDAVETPLLLNEELEESIVDLAPVAEETFDALAVEEPALDFTEAEQESVYVPVPDEANEPRPEQPEIELEAPVIKEESALVEEITSEDNVSEPEASLVEEPEMAFESEAIATSAEVEEDIEVDVDVDVSLSEEEDNLDELLELIQISSLASFSAPIPSVDLSHEEIVSELTSTGDTSYTEEETALLAATLPPHGVALTGKEEDKGLSAYLEIAELDSLYDTSGYEFPTLKLPEVIQNPAAQENQDPYLSIFTQNNLAYWMGSSRLGESIQLKDDLTSVTPFYFQPELILEHVKEKNAPAPAPEVSPTAKLDMQLDIINQFLKATPKRKTLANAQLSQEPQEDLSAKSSKIKKNLVSENLALILIKQGKGKKAIKIYEQLIVKFPEKKSYFAEQIEKLRNE
ncbi:hypothetical protein [Rufibacter hautae]|uniref:Tetratricopeptide repeat protein n=1 Tax=Rufibacter hautae TaxID=2595005 RepID=A0A5B6TPI2_9BACT|nr:hypothetical protein [Rufibacter hautae]KAA3438323.1 hypothetical protein FOA19_13815 [Rufibacter hautae]